MTDSEIIKALECCAIDDCKECPVKFGVACKIQVAVEAITHIKYQQAEIERLEGLATNMEYCANHALDEIEKEKREAIKDFAERLKAKAYKSCEWWPILHAVDAKDIDALVEEMEGENGRT